MMRNASPLSNGRSRNGASPRNRNAGASKLERFHSRLRTAGSRCADGSNANLTAGQRKALRSFTHIPIRMDESYKKAIALSVEEPFP